MSSYKHKKVAILGLSTEGTDATRFFLNEGAEVHCCDRRSASELATFIETFKNEHIHLHLGKEYLRELDHYDLLIRTSGMALFLPELAAARKNPGQLSSLTNIFFDECHAKIIGVTGTKGKGTTSSLIYEMLKTGGKSVYLGGNIGKPLLSSVRHIKQTDWVVLELSSFQLEDLHKSPHIAVVLPITQDHISNFDPLASNYHKSREDYVKAKKSIVTYQYKQDVAILHKDNQTSSAFAQGTKATCFFYSAADQTVDAYVQNDNVYVRHQDQDLHVCNIDEIKLRGKHNLENIAAAALAALACGVSIASIKEVARTFEGLEHRLELVHKYREIAFYNDSFSTVPETTIAALKSFTEPLILIVGGSEKGSDFTELGKEIVHSSVKVVILIGHMADRIEAAIKNTHSKNMPVMVKHPKDMKQIVDVAVDHAVAGDVVLLSPACASFDMFKNYKERGSQFKHYVKEIGRS